MNVTLQSTDRIVTINGIPARAWEGVSEKGTPVIAFITRIAVPRDASTEDYAQFAAELQEHDPPQSPDVQNWPARMLIDVDPRVDDAVEVDDQSTHAV